jgi:thioesterase domain-containing protein
LARHLGPEQPFYALQQVGLRESQNLPNAIQKMASEYLLEIQKVQTEGPYFLGGFCFGGVVAFEMANQLRSQGREVALLTLFAVRPDDFPSLVSAKALRNYQHYDSIPENLKRKLLHLLGIGSRESFIYLKNLLSKNVAIIKRDITSRIHYSMGRLWSTDQELYIKRANREAFKPPQDIPGSRHPFLGRGVDRSIF